jgi:2-polyprenyl-3-methyl-5-hydroxy-6-metoxy-1,4-benzoquinol methylase
VPDVAEFGWDSLGDELGTERYLNPLVLGLLPPAPGRVLDLGCGDGRFAKAMSDRGLEVVGVDGSADGIAIGRKLYPGIRFEQLSADPGLLGRLGEEPFGTVVSMEVVEHVYDPHAWAATCFEALRPGGQLICTTPYHGYLKNLLIALTDKSDFHWHPLRVGGHIKFWSRETLSALLEQHGFTVSDFYGAGRLPRLWKSMVITATRKT